MSQPEDKKGQVETTGHVWDGDLREYNNPLPRWWLWAFYGTIIFAVIYWIMYPAWPYGDTFTKGLNTITYQVEDEDGELREVTEHWNTRALFNRDMRTSPSALAHQEWVSRVEDMTFEEIESDPDTLQFALSVGHGTFGDFCAACHAVGGQGVDGIYPNLTNDAWIWSRDNDTIMGHIKNGINGNMPGFAQYEGQELEELSRYVLSMMGEAEISGEAASRAEGSYATCAGCHGADGGGNPMLGAPALNDGIWQGGVNIPACGDDESCKIEKISDVIVNGIERHMPGFEDRLTETQIRMLTVYVQQLSGQ